MAIFFTSDWHLGDTKLEKLGRPYSDVNEAADAMAKLYDQHICETDTVYMLGDCVRDPSWPGWQQWLENRPGTKILIRGNHDRYLEDADLAPYFETIVPEGEGIFLDLEHEGQTMKAYLNHYPTRARVDVDMNLVGHVHSQWKVQKGMINVGVDAHMLQPVTVPRIFFLHDAICNVYDDDVWVADHVANKMHERRGVDGSYFPPKGSS